MNSRERFMDILASIPDDERADKEYKADAAALRELDQLMSEMVQYLSVYNPDKSLPISNMLLERAAQAGYGEK